MCSKKSLLLFPVLLILSLFVYEEVYRSWAQMSSDASPPEPSRTKRINVVFLKTHKTAGSTMQNIFYRFAERHNLTVALPKQSCGGYQFCFPNSFNIISVDPSTLPANIITNHLRFNKAELQRLMSPDTAYITIMREPSSMFESLFAYCYVSSQSIRRVPGGSLETFLNDPLRYYRANERDSIYARNCLTFDLGGDKDRTDMAYAEYFASHVEKSFSLVMISEYFDESLILLRHLLNWDLDDLVYFKVNMRSEKSKKSLTPDLKAKIRAWISMDAYLYDHFNASLWRQLSELGLDLVQKEVQMLRQAQEKMMVTCFGGEIPRFRLAGQIKDQKLRPWQPGNVDMVGYELSPNITSPEDQKLCMKFIMPELPRTDELRQSQAHLDKHW